MDNSQAGRVSFRTDRSTEAAISALLSGSALTRSEVVRAAIHDAADAKRRAALRAEAEALAADPQDRDEALATIDFLDDDRAW
ncbi:MAG: hypothetical protein ACT4PP_02240 [Sporichthyaceae bacterium]